MLNDKENQVRWQNERDFGRHRRDMWQEAGYAPSQIPRRAEFDIYPTKHLLQLLDKCRPPSSTTLARSSRTSTRSMASERPAKRDVVLVICWGALRGALSRNKPH